MVREDGSLKERWHLIVAFCVWLRLVKAFRESPRRTSQCNDTRTPTEQDIKMVPCLLASQQSAMGDTLYMLLTV